MSQDFQLTPGTLPGGIGYCFTNFQQLNVDIVTQISGQLRAGASFYNNGETEPQPDKRTTVDGTPIPWFKPSTGYWWEWKFGTWVRPNPEAASSDARRIFVGTLTDLKTYDGGDTGMLGDASGPMWEEDTAMRARFPLGAGSLPSGIVIANTTTGGEEKHILTIAELPEDSIPVQTDPVPAPDGLYLHHDNVTESDQGVNRDPSLNRGDGEAHNNMPPYYGVYFIKRTTRGWYKM